MANKRHPDVIKRDLKAKQNQLDELTKKIDYLNKEKNRKARTHRLIQTGALAEKYFELPDDLSINEREELFKMFANYVNHNKPSKFKK